MEEKENAMYSRLFASEELSPEEFIKQVIALASHDQNAIFVIDISRARPDDRVLRVSTRECQIWFDVPIAAIRSISPIGLGCNNDPGKVLALVTFAEGLEDLAQTFSSLGKQKITSDPRACDHAGCWIHVYEDDNYNEEDRHTVINGPAELVNLRNINGADWGDSIGSLRVGPNAHVRAFEDEGFQDTEWNFGPNYSNPDLDEINADDDIDSMIIQCSKCGATK